MIRHLLILISVIAALAIFGCASSTTGGRGTGGGGIQGRLYLSEPTANSVLRFDNAFTATGGVAASATVSGATTQLQSPQHLLLDETNNRLFVANAAGSSILIFENATTRTGNVAPDRTISGASTTLTAPAAVAVDRTRDLVYVADGSNIMVFSPASTTNGNTIPVRTMNIGFAAEAIFLDSTNDRLFAADSLNNGIDVYDLVSTRPSGATVASRIVTGASTGLNHPAGLGLDATGRLVVSNLNAPSITIFANAATATGNVAPAATISGGNTGFTHPTQLVLNNNPGTGDSGDVYVADNSAASVMVFTNIGTASGNVAPARKITGLTGVKGVALDTTR
ncbi:MAG TPA: hypothetical protein VN176_09725 [Verrucomicrobiae bacterium]|jgi:hypothetical protein|nr:hypothetical protein [Verrucomicrobiae bacterium]